MPKSFQDVFFNEAQIRAGVEEIARSVSRWLRKREAKALNIVSILEGAKPFTRDLMDVLKIIEPDLHLELHEIRMKGTDGHQHLLKDREWQSGSLNNLEHIQKYPVLIVDDLVDSGLTLAALKQVLASQSIEVKTAVLIRKFGEASGPVDFFGFDLKWSQQVLAQKGFRDCWLYGYGMDLDGQKRELRQIEGVYIPLE